MPDIRQRLKHQQKQKAHVQPRDFEHTFFAQEGVKFNHLGLLLLFLCFLHSSLPSLGRLCLVKQSTCHGLPCVDLCDLLTLFIVASFHELPWFDFSCLPLVLPMKKFWWEQ